MGMEENKAAIERFLSQEVFFGEEANLRVVDEVFASDVVFRGPENEAQVVGTAAIDLIKSELRGYQNVGGEIAILGQIAEGESVATRYRLEVGEGEQRPAFAGVTFSRFADDGMIHEYLVLVGEYVDWSEDKPAHN